MMRLTVICIVTAMVLAYVFTPTGAQSSSGGITGVTTSGCTCHGSAPSSAVSVTLEGPRTVNPSSTTSYELVITGGPLSGAGTNISIQNGTLIESGATRKSGAELTHWNVTLPVSGAVRFPFSITAPATAGTMTLRAAGNSVNVDGGTGGDQWNFLSPVTITVDPVTSVKEGMETPRQFALRDNYPNPFNPSTTIPFDIPEAGAVTLRIFSARGEEVATLLDDARQAGSHAVVWNAENQPSGAYFARLTLNGRSVSKKLILAK